MVVMLRYHLADITQVTRVLLAQYTDHVEPALVGNIQYTHGLCNRIHQVAPMCLFLGPRQKLILLFVPQGR